MSKLAVKGGGPVRAKPFPSWPVFDRREIEAVTDVVKSGKWWRFSYGEGVDLKESKTGDRSKVVEFQESFAAHHGARYGIAAANGTASIEIAAKALGIGPGDEVIVPAYTYVATATAVLQVNAVPIFVDIDPDTYNIDFDRVEEAVTDRTKAVIPVHFGGQAVDIDRMQETAKKHGLSVIEDAAHAHGAEWNGRKVGVFGDAGSFSFQNSKNMTAGEGGIIITNDARLAELSESYLWAGRERGRPWYEMHRLGWNYRMTEFQGAILGVQLDRLEKQNEVRMKNACYLSRELEKIGGLSPLKVDDRVTRHSYHIYIIRYSPEYFNYVPRQKFVEALNAEGIPSFYGYTAPLYANPMFTNMNFYPHGCPVECSHYGKKIDYALFKDSCPVAERASYSEAVWLEHRLFLGDTGDMDDIVSAVKKIKDNIDELQNS